MAGNAIGLGNFLRFPVKAAANGGGAFMIPYFVAFLLLGIPMMWVEWTIGRMGGAHGHGTTPGMLHLLWKKAPSKYLGALGIVIPFVIVIYYNFIESWCLGYSWFSVTGKYFGHANREAMGQFLRGFQGVESNEFFSSLAPILIFWGITIALNFFFLYKGISKGIEILAKYGMPLLFIFGIILAIRVLTLGTPDPVPARAEHRNGMGFIWNPDFSRLGSASVWLVAAGQIFFTLSLGQGIINTYASYVREKQDITLNGLTTSSTNEFAEVILGGTIAIPVAVAFFGLAETQVIANERGLQPGLPGPAGHLPEDPARPDLRRHVVLPAVHRRHHLVGGHDPAGHRLPRGRVQVEPGEGRHRRLLRPRHHAAPSSSPSSSSASWTSSTSGPARSAWSSSRRSRSSSSPGSSGSRRAGRRCTRARTSRCRGSSSSS